MASTFDTGRPRRSLVFPLLLVAAGLILLLQNFGLVPWGLWSLLWRFWPIVLVLIGLELIFRRVAPRLATLLTLLIVAAVVVAVIAAAAVGGVDFARPASGAVAEDRLVEPLEPLVGTEQAAVEIKFGAGDLTLGGLPEDSPNLVEGDLMHSDALTVVKDVQRRNSEIRLVLENRGHVSFPFGGQIVNQWDLLLTPRLPLDLRLQTGASRANLDLDGLRVSRLQIDAGASDVTTRLPRASGTTRAAIKAGAASVTVEVPEGVAARIRVKSAIGSVRIDERRFPRSGGWYVSPDYDTAVNRVDLDLDTGAASVIVR